MLFNLDNLDHLPEGRDKVTAILTAAPQVKILATSRAALRLKEEWFHPLGGLSVPPNASSAERDEAFDNEATSPQAYDAVRLFEQRARHARLLSLWMERWEMWFASAAWLEACL